jgi:hypothetical protein
MSFPDNITRITDVLMTLLQSPLGVVVVTERVRHAGVALHSHRVARRFEELGILMRLVPAKVVLCRDNVGPWHALEGLCKYRRCHPVAERSFSKFCMQL